MSKLGEPVETMGLSFSSFLGLLVIAGVVIMLFIEPPNLQVQPSGFSYPKSFICGEVRNQFAEACAKAERIIQEDNKIRELLADKEYEIEKMGSYPPDEPEKIFMVASIRFNRTYVVRINSQEVETNEIQIQIDLRNERATEIIVIRPDSTAIKMR